ncbi:LINE-1 retrotransposable element ORF1 protein, partial [Lemmus lemmus]
MEEELWHRVHPESICDHQILAKMSWTLREHGCKPRLPYLAKLSITIDEVYKIFHDKTRKNLKENSNPR